MAAATDMYTRGQPGEADNRGESLVSLAVAAAAVVPSAHVQGPARYQSSQHVWLDAGAIIAQHRPGPCSLLPAASSEQRSLKQVCWSVVKYDSKHGPVLLLY